jgi:hypothetical protein
MHLFGQSRRHGIPMKSINKVNNLKKHIHTLNLECKNFKCPNCSLSTRCCCRPILYNQPSFRTVPSVLEKECALQGLHIIFLPKFHPELSLIEQCWGFAKRVYREYPPSMSEHDLEKNVCCALDLVLLVNMRKWDLSVINL